MEIVGIDVGFGFTKAYNGTDSVIFKSIIGEAADIEFNSFLGDDSASSNLHVTLNDKTYFLGNFAELQSNIRDFTLEQDKFINDFVKILAVTAAGMCCSGDEPLNVVSGLPVGFLKRDTRKFKEAVTGTHELTFHKENGQDISKKITIAKIHMIPQPIGSIFNLIFDDTGKIADRNLAMQKLGVVDIGFKTTDFSIFDHLKYIQRGSSTMETGISKCFSVIANKLRQESNIDIELFRMFKFVASGAIKIKGKEYNISNLKKRVYNHTASAISRDLNRLWEDDWDIDSIILSGGGSNEIGEYLAPKIEGNIIPIPKNIDARFNNVQGYLKFGRYKWGHTQGSSSGSARLKKSPGETPLQETDTGGPADSRENGKSSRGMGWLKRQA
ncbi:MAG: ParM/StbA family protein [Desulfobacteraceae bacterium]